MGRGEMIWGDGIMVTTDNGDIMGDIEWITFVKRGFNILFQLSVIISRARMSDLRNLEILIATIKFQVVCNKTDYLEPWKLCLKSGHGMETSLASVVNYFWRNQGYLCKIGVRSSTLW